MPQGTLDVAGCECYYK